MRIKLTLLAVLAATGIAAAQSYSVLYSFGGTNQGYAPQNGLVADAVGNLYGTTAYGGASTYGTIFELPVTGGEKVLYTFSGNWDGAYPASSVILDAAGNIYGTARQGGYSNCQDFGCGLVFKLTPDHRFTALHIFRDAPDGSFPGGGLILDGLGNLYGTTSYGGLGYGVIYRIDPSGHEKVLYKFKGTPDGNSPVSQLVRDSSGNLYGTTQWGGSAGYGTVYRLDRTGKETVLYSFTGAPDGRIPGTGTLIFDPSGNLYGTTQYGGDLSCFQNAAGCGVVYKLDKAGNETILYTFHGGTDGGVPVAGVILDSKGNLYGTASYGGDFDGPSCSNVGCGIIYELSPAGQETILHTFRFTDGAAPEGGLIFQKGYLYGTAEEGGSKVGGVAFQLQP